MASQARDQVHRRAQCEGMSVQRALREKKATRAQVTVSLLGAPRIEIGGRSVEFDTRKALTIVAYLAMTPGRQLRERLAAMFWQRRIRSANAARRRPTAAGYTATQQARARDRPVIEWDRAGGAAR